MGEQIIISINREYGSGGHVIAEMLAKDLDLPLYDRNLLDEIAKEKGINAEHYEEFDEKPKNPMFSRRVRGHSNSMEEHLAELQFEYLKKKADSGESFVVVGRCSETILKDNKNLVSIFVLADRNDKVSRIQEKYGWGDSRGYDLCVNSSRMGIEGTAKMLERYIEHRRQQ